MEDDGQEKKKSGTCLSTVLSSLSQIDFFFSGVLVGEKGLLFRLRLRETTRLAKTKKRRGGAKKRKSGGLCLVSFFFAFLPVGERRSLALMGRGEREVLWYVYLCMCWSKRCSRRRTINRNIFSRIQNRSASKTQPAIEAVHTRNLEG